MTKIVTLCNIDPQEPILRLLILQLQRQRCSRLERFSKFEENIFVFQKR
jgi:hypothetical protein